MTEKLCSVRTTLREPERRNVDERDVDKHFIFMLLDYLFLFWLDCVFLALHRCCCFGLGQGRQTDKQTNRASGFPRPIHVPK